MNSKKKPRRCRGLGLDSGLDLAISRFTNSLAYKTSWKPFYDFYLPAFSSLPTALIPHTFDKKTFIQMVTEKDILLEEFHAF